jgi:YVTN family beta-propeller protein
LYCNLEPRPRNVFPSGVALTPDGSRAYIKTGACAALRLNTDDLETAFIPGAGSFSAAGAIVIGPDARRAYLTDSPTDSVLVLDLEADEFVAAIPVGEAPNDAVITPDGGLVYVVNEGHLDPKPDTVSVIDTSTNSVTDVVTVGDRPVGIALAADGQLAYVANVNGDTVSVIDVAARATIGSIPVSGNPSYPTVSPDGDMLYVMNNDGLVVIDLSSQMVQTVVPIVQGRSAVTSDGTALYVLDALSEAVSVVDTASLTVETSIPLPTSACGTPEFCEPKGITIGAIPGGCHACTGDCNGDGRVVVNELVTGVRIALGQSNVETCSPMDADANGWVSVNELVAAVGAALNGCAG